MYSILVVDDEAPVRNMLTELLKAQEYRVTNTATVNKALRSIKEDMKQ